MRMDVFLNGEHQCTAGIDGFGLVSVLVTSVRRSGYSVAVFGGTMDGIGSSHVSKWTNKWIRIGDEVRVKVLEEGPATPPVGLLTNDEPDPESWSEAARVTGAFGMKVFRNDQLLCKAGFEAGNPRVNPGTIPATANNFNGWQIMRGARDLAANAIHSADRFIANAALAEIGVYLHQYRAQHGRFPDTLDAIVPEFAESLPEDPFSGNPFVYKPAENEYILYSLGMNYQDDGGVHDVVDGDMVWCISHHAQP